MGHEFLIECEDWTLRGWSGEIPGEVDEEGRASGDVTATVTVEVKRWDEEDPARVMMIDVEAEALVDGIRACLGRGPAFAVGAPVISFADIADVAAQAVRTWGRPAQTAMIVEEFGEFLTAFARLSRGRSSPEQVIDEAADVIVVLGAALALVNDDPTDALQKLAEAVDRKVARLRKRLANAQPLT